jgi:cyclophilin family peptidyl-prolyl cis-trans isomerase
MFTKISALLLGVFALSIIGVFTMNSEEMADKNKKPETKSTNPRYEISVTQKGQSLGKIVVELYPDKAPKHCKNFDELVASKSYDGTAFHRVIPGFMIQGGDPNSKDKPKGTWGMGDPSQKRVPAEFNDIKHVPGILSAARSQDPNSATSQFFIMDGANSGLDGQYSAFGHVITGMDVVKKIVNSPRDARDNPNDKIEMKIVKLK